MISVIIPAYNNIATIRQAYDSVVDTLCRAKSDDGHEIILVDDGATDGTGNVLDDILDASDEAAPVSVRVIHLSKNEGPAAARNRGLKEARGRYVMFVDADDTIDSDAAGVLLSALRHDDGSKADVVIAGLRRIRHGRGRDEEFLQTDAIAKLIEKKGGSDEMSVGEDFFDMLDAGILNSPCAKLYRRSVIADNDIIMPTSLDMGEDFQFNLSFLRHAKSIRLVAKSIYTYEVERSILTYRYRENLFDERKISVDMLREFLRDMGLDESISFYLYEKLLISAAMQDIGAKKDKNTRTERIQGILATKELKEAIERIRPRGKMERAVAFAVGTKSPFVISAFSRLALMVRNSASDSIARVSI